MVGSATMTHLGPSEGLHVGNTGHRLSKCPLAHCSPEALVFVTRNGATQEAKIALAPAITAAAGGDLGVRKPFLQTPLPACAAPCSGGRPSAEPSNGRISPAHLPILGRFWGRFRPCDKVNLFEISSSAMAKLSLGHAGLRFGHTADREPRPSCAIGSEGALPISSCHSLEKYCKMK